MFTAPSYFRNEEDEDEELDPRPRDRWGRFIPCELEDEEESEEGELDEDWEEDLPEE